MKQKKEVLCEACPAWKLMKMKDGSPQLVPEVTNDGKPAVDTKGRPIFIKDSFGNFIRTGWCAAKLPQLVVLPAGLVTAWPETRSHQTCESPEKHDLIDRLRQKGQT